MGKKRPGKRTRLAKLQERQRARKFYKVKGNGKPTGNSTEETLQNRAYFRGMQDQLVDNLTTAQFKGALMAGVLPKYWTRVEVRKSIEAQRANDLWRKDGETLIEIVERKDLRTKGVAKRWFPVVYCFKTIVEEKNQQNRQNHIFTLFGELRDTYEAADKLAQEMREHAKEHWDTIGFRKEEENDKYKKKN